jgi:membrane protease YdiL (CAAX protease family)
VPRHGASVRRQWVSFIAGWLVFVAFLVGLAAWEAVRVAEARATVADGWGTGLAAGVGGGLALSALLTVTVLVQLRRNRPWRGGRPLLVLAVTIALLLFFAVLTSTPPRRFEPNPVPYVVTSGIGVAEIAYVSTCLALLAVLPAVAIPMARMSRRRRSDRRGWP